jgi:hypothetical protein
VHAEARAGVGALDAQEEVLTVLQAQDKDVVQRVLPRAQILRERANEQRSDATLRSMGHSRGYDYSPGQSWC